MGIEQVEAEPGTDLHILNWSAELLTPKRCFPLGLLTGNLEYFFKWAKDKQREHILKCTYISWFCFFFFEEKH